MKIIISAGFPYNDGKGYIHGEEQDGDCFVSKELLDAVKAYLIESFRTTLLHHDHTAVYSSSDPKDKR